LLCASALGVISKTPRSTTAIFHAQLYSQGCGSAEEAGGCSLGRTATPNAEVPRTQRKHFEKSTPKASIQTLASSFVDFAFSALSASSAPLRWVWSVRRHAKAAQS